MCSFLIDSGFNTPDQILLAQLHPEAFFGCDVFLQLYQYLASLARRTGFKIVMKANVIKNCFGFAAINDIHGSLQGTEVFNLPRCTKRPFFSPLVRFSKLCANLTQFIISGTEMNLTYLHEMLWPIKATSSDVSLKYFKL